MTFLLRAAGLLCVLAASLPAQSWQSLRGIQAGSTVRVSQSDGKQQTGRWKSVSDDTVLFETRRGEVSLLRPQIRRIEVRHGGRRLRNGAIGAAIGVAVGITVDQTLGTRLRNESSGNGGRALSYSLPIGLFAGIGALQPGWQTVYRIDRN